MSNKIGRWSVVVLTAPLWCPIWLVMRYEEKANSLAYGIYDFIVFMHKAWKYIIVLIHKLGWLCTIIILTSSIFILVQSVLVEFEIMSSHPAIYNKLVNIFKAKESWAAATSIVGGTVAMGHVWSLELNREKFYEEKAERRRKERREQKAKI